MTGTYSTRQCVALSTCAHVDQPVKTLCQYVDHGMVTAEVSMNYPDSVDMNTRKIAIHMHEVSRNAKEGCLARIVQNVSLYFAFVFV